MSYTDDEEANYDPQVLKFYSVKDMNTTPSSNCVKEVIAQLQIGVQLQVHL
jgi:hypothetical protein